MEHFNKLARMALGGILIYTTVACAALTYIPSPQSSSDGHTDIATPVTRLSPSEGTRETAKIDGKSRSGSVKSTHSTSSGTSESNTQPSKRSSNPVSPVTSPDQSSNDPGPGDTLDEEFVSKDDFSEDSDEEIGVTYDIPVVKNASVDGYIEYFQVTIRERFEKWLSRSSRYLPTMTKIFRDHGLPEDLVFVALIESGFNPYAYSRAKATGTWQFMYATGKRYGLTINEWVDERRDPIKSTVAAASYLRDLYAMFGSWPLALASYNAGEGKIQKAIRRTKSDDFWDIKNTRHIRRETKDYVPKYMAATIIAKSPERYGFSLTAGEPLLFDEVIVDRPISLGAAADAIGVDALDMKDLNPELKRGITPPYSKNYVLRIPEGTKERFLAGYENIPTYKGPFYVKHRVRRGESLGLIARRYGTTVGALKAANHLRSNQIRAGSLLTIPKYPNDTPVARSRKGGITKISVAAPLETQKRLVYRVRSGDTLTSIAARFNVTLSNILKWNGTKRNELIHPGDRIVLYTNAEQS